MRTFATTITLALILLAAAAGPDIQSQDRPAVRGIGACNKALELLEEGKPADALKILEAAKGTMDAQDEWLWRGNCGLCHRDLRQDDKALEHFAKAVELQPDCWFRFAHCRLLHQFGRWDEALRGLEQEIDPDYAERAGWLKNVIDGPFKSRWPLTWRKLELRSKKNNYHIVSDVGVTVEEMDALEAAAGKLDLANKADQKKLEKLIKPHDDLVSIANLAELARDEYIRFTGMREADLPKGKVFKVFFMMKEADFHGFANDCGDDGESEHTLGFYEPNMKFLQLYSQEGAESKVCGLALDTVDTFFHEGWHQFFDMLTEQTPIWVDEGIAEFLGHASVKNKGAKIELGLLIRSRGDTYTRYERIREAITQNEYIPFTKFFRYTYKEWNDGDVNINYAQAWSIAYFALQGKDEAFRRDYSKLYIELVKGRLVNEIVDEIFPEEKLKTYEASWLKYWKTT